MIYTKTHNKAQSLQITWCRAPQKNPQIGESVTTELQTGRGPLLEKKKMTGDTETRSLFYCKYLTNLHNMTKTSLQNNAKMLYFGI